MTGKGGRREVSDAMMRSVGIVVEADQRERGRVADLLRRDREDAKAEERRRAAEIEVAEGKFVNLEDTKIGPTPERMAKAVADDLVAKVLMKDRIEGTVRKVETVRVGATRLIQLHSRGVIDGDMFAACKWYRDTWDMAGFELIRAGCYGQRLTRDGVGVGSMKPDRVMEARSDFLWARDFVPVDVRGLFELVVLAEWTLKAAQTAGKCRYENVTAALRHGALMLHGGVAHRLQIGEW